MVILQFSQHRDSLPCLCRQHNADKQRPHEHSRIATEINCDCVVVSYCFWWCTVDIYIYSVDVLGTCDKAGSDVRSALKDNSWNDSSIVASQIIPRAISVTMSSHANEKKCTVLCFHGERWEHSTKLVQLHDWSVAVVPLSTMQL